MHPRRGNAFPSYVELIAPGTDVVWSAEPPSSAAERRRRPGPVDQKECPLTQQTPPDRDPGRTLPSLSAIEPELAGIRNFRDLGGLPTADGRRIRQGVLFRSGHLAHATETDAVFLSSLGLHTVFDFRNAADIALDGPDIALGGVRNVNLPLTDPADGSEFWKLVREGDLGTLRGLLSDGRGAQRMIDSYREIITTRTAEHSQVLGALAEDSLPVLMHCAAGKDRAGLSIAVTLLAVGVAREAIEADYLESAAVHRRYKVWRSRDSDDAMAPEAMELLSPLFDARVEYLAAAFEAIEQTWGSTERYLTEGLGCGAEQRERLRERLLIR